MYAIKSQCVHDLRGLVVSIVTNVPGATHDVTFAQRTIAEIERIVRPRKPRDEDDDPRIDADGSDDEDAENGRLLMVDSGYQGLQHIVPCVLPYKKRANRPLTAQEKQHNRRLSRRRVLVENYYGRLKRRYRIMTDKYRGERGAYPAYFKLCVALTNFHIMKHPLRI
jgi:transposase